MNERQFLYFIIHRSYFIVPTCFRIDFSLFLTSHQALFNLKNLNFTRESLFDIYSEVRYAFFSIFCIKGNFLVPRLMRKGTYFY
jgi:hypothetical protein